MLDSSCGSMLWMPLVLREYQKEVPDFRFYGSDVVCSLIDQHKANYTMEANWQFGCNDYGGQGRSARQAAPYVLACFKAASLHSACTHRLACASPAQRGAHCAGRRKSTVTTKRPSAPPNRGRNAPQRTSRCRLATS